MHVRRPPKTETNLTALHRRWECVVSLIRLLERYQRAPVCLPQGCSRRAPRTAA